MKKAISLFAGILFAAAALSAQTPKPTYPYGHAYHSTVNDQIVFADAWSGATTAAKVMTAISASVPPAIVIIPPGMSGTAGDFTGITLTNANFKIEDQRGTSIIWGFKIPVGTDVIPSLTANQNGITIGGPLSCLTFPDATQQCTAASGGGTPGGAPNSVQYNNGGVFDGFGTWNGSALTVPGLMYPSIVPGAQAEYLAYLDGSGTVLHDQSGNGHDCTFAGTAAPTWTSTGGGIDFGETGTTSYLTCSGTPLSGAKTIQIFLSASVPGTNDAAINNVEFIMADSAANGIGLRPMRSGMISLQTGFTVTAQALNRAVGPTDAAFTCTTPASIYFNGTAAMGSLNSGNCPTFSSTGNTYIGTNSGSAAFQFSGTIYAILIYSSALTAAQIKQNHDAVVNLLAQHGVSGFQQSLPPYMLIYEGDSRMANSSDTYRMTTSRPFYIARAMPSSSTFWNVSIESQSAGTISGSAHLVAVDYPLLRLIPAANKTILTDMGTNDIAPGNSAAVYGYLQSFCSAVHTNSPGTKVVATTIMPSSNKTGTTETSREALNTSHRVRQDCRNI